MRYLLDLKWKERLYAYHGGARPSGYLVGKQSKFPAHRLQATQTLIDNVSNRSPSGHTVSEGLSHLYLCMSFTPIEE